MDRIYTNVPEWELLCASVVAKVLQDPSCLRRSWDTDHAPTLAVVGVRRKMHNENRPVASSTFRSLVLREAHDKLAPCLRLEQRRGFERVSQDDSDGAGSPLALSSVARAVWSNNAATAADLSKSRAEARLHVKVAKCCVPLVNPVAFNARRGEEDGARGQGRKSRQGLPEGRRSKGALRHLGKLWSPLSKKTALTGVLVDEGLLTSVARSEVGMS